MSGLEEKLRQIAEEKQRIAEQELALREEGLAEYERVLAQIEVLEQKKEQLEGFLGLAEGQRRAGRGEIVQLCLSIITESGGGMSSGEVRDAIERKSPGMKVTSVPASLSRLASQGRLRRDDHGRYFLS